MIDVLIWGPLILFVIWLLLPARKERVGKGE